MDEQKPQQPLNILCVDDDENVLKALTRLFRSESFQVLTAVSGREGLAILKRTENVVVILSDQQMPEMTGTLFLREAGKLFPESFRMLLTGYREATAAIDAINQGGVQRYLTKPWNDDELLQAVRDGVQRYLLSQENRRLTTVLQLERDELAEWNSNLKKRLLQQSAQIRKQLAEARPQSGADRKAGEVIVARLVDLLDQCYSRIGKHSRTVAALAESMAETLKLPSTQCEEIKSAAFLHDIGKLGLPDRLLSRGTELMNADDVKEYRTHSVRGMTIVDKHEELREVAILIRHHHEAYNGQGFPDGLRGERIPLGSRIIALADYAENCFTKEGTPSAKYLVTKTITGEMGRLFDPELAFAANIAVMQILR